MELPERITDTALALSQRCALLSEDIYTNSGGFSHTIFGDMLSNWYQKGRGASLVAISEHPDSIYVTFRGTDFSNKSQVKSDMNINWIDEPDIGYVSTGFRQELDYVYYAMFEELQRVLRKSRIKKPFYLTGHSLGGALATLCAARLALYGLQESKKHYLPSGLITFGCPRVGDADFAKHLHLCLNVLDQEDLRRIGICRYRNNNDIVTRVPSGVRGYRHAGEVIYIDPKGGFHIEPWWHKRLWWGVTGAGFRVLSDAFEDHRMKYYRAAIVAAANSRGI